MKICIIKITIAILIVVPLNLYSQNLTLSGKVHFRFLQDSGKVYFAKQGEIFDKNKFIKYDKNKKFRFEMSIAKIKKDSIQLLVFSLDTAQRTDNINACVQRINVGKIVNSNAFENSKNITLKTDLLLGINCAAGPLREAEEENKGRFVGSYSFKLNDTIRYIELGNLFFLYKSKFSKTTKENMVEEYGIWDYDEEKKLLRFHIWRQTNNYGLAIYYQYKFEFNIEETENGMKITPKNGKGIITKI